MTMEDLDKMHTSVPRHIRVLERTRKNAYGK